MAIFDRMPDSPRARTSLRILIVRKGSLFPTRLEQEIRAAGDVVVGPFADIDEAISQAAQAQAAILDIGTDDDRCFAIANALRSIGMPFVVLTDDLPAQGAQTLHQRFPQQRTYPRPSSAGPILHDLRQQHRSKGPHRDESMEQIVLDMIRRSGGMMPDKASADRLVEAALLRAIAAKRRGGLPGDLRLQLMGLLDEEYLRHGRTHLN